MRVLFSIGHPGHVHLFRYAGANLEKRGHKVYYAVCDIPVAKRLMDCYGMSYFVLGKKRDGIWGKAFTIIERDIKLFWFVLIHKIDIGMSSGIELGHVSKVTPMTAFNFDDDDDEVEKLVVKYGHPFVDVVLSPSAVELHRKSKHAIFYKGYHELAYLHPNVYKPDPSVLNRLGVNENERYFVMRFVALKGHHDIGQKGLSFEQKLKLVNILNQYGRVIITSERAVDKEFEQYRLPVPPEDMHSVMYYSSLFIGDSQTMTSEAAVLGVPSLRCNTFVGRISYLEEEEHRYALTFGFTPDNFDKLLEKLEELLSNPNLKDEWQEKRKKLLSEKIDVSAFFTWFIENYPESKKIMQENPDYQMRFK